MKRTFFSGFLLLLVIATSVNAQISYVDSVLSKYLKQHISYLASDRLEGREAGKKGEQLASEYITARFVETGLSPKGSHGYLQSFPFEAGKKMGPKNQFSVNKKNFRPDEDFFPLPYFTSGSVSGEAVRVGYGIIAPALDHNDYQGRKDLTGKIFILEAATPDGSNPHGKFSDFTDLQTRVDTAVARGASGVIFINSIKDVDDPARDYMNKYKRQQSIPVIFAKKSVLPVLSQDGPLHVTIEVDLEKIELTGHNVIGFLDNKAPYTIVIGAHYDHLGMGSEGSLYRGTPAIHNGADDNASGVAALIELARALKQGKETGNNYLFIAFSGEEKGLLGSNYFVKNPTIELSKINYMMNMDMVGRLKKDEKTLLIAGSGTSPVWKEKLDAIHVDSIHYKLTESGVGPSDHTSFYLKDIPVLHFFSGSHEDYHKPSDDEDKINYPGAVSIVKIMTELIVKLDTSGKLAFTKTNDSNNEEVPRFKVTLGVVPDYAYEGAGMRIDGVSDGKPASKAGLKAGDIVIQLGDFPVADMMTYMKALGKFTKGETTIVKYKRDGETRESEISF